MIVDCHTHVDFSGGSEAVAEHFKSIEKLDKCIVLAEPGSDYQQINDDLAKYANSHKEKIVGFAYLDPIAKIFTVKDINAITKKKGLSGLVIYCCMAGFHPAHSRAMCFYEAAEEIGLPVFFHNGPNLDKNAKIEYAQPILLDEIARRFSSLKIIIGDMGVPFFEQTVLMVGKHENVYADLSVRTGHVWQTYNMVVRAYEEKVMHKLLFGSGYPLGQAGQSMETLLGFNKMLGQTNLPVVPRGDLRNVIERDTIELLGIVTD